jgi:hypothetical protein
MRNALSTPSTARRAQSRPDDSSLATPAEEPAGVSKSQAAKETRVTAPDGTGRPVESTEAARQSDARGSRESTAKTEQAGVDADATKVSKQEEPPRLPQEPVSSQGNSNAKLPEDSLEALKAVPDSLAQQAAKALPKLSEELLKKAAELRADELKPGDIEKLRKAAEFLAGDLAKIAQSEELQKALQEMARQIRPEQIEQVARELGNQEQLKRELEAAARLLSENQQAKEMVAGLAGQFARMQDQRQGRDKNRRGGLSDDKARAGDGASQSGGENSGGAPEKIEAADRRLGAQGRESKLKGKLQERPGGEYLYLQSKAGVGAARAPYSSVYPQYRREAERSVQRSQVPPNLRTVVRKYFDAINPDAKR